MASTKVRFENQRTGATREAPVGFSWTVLLFGPFPALFRSDWKWFLIISLIGSLTLGISNIVFCFIYNKFYIRDLIADGYKTTAIEDYDIAETQHISNSPFINRMKEWFDEFFRFST